MRFVIRHRRPTNKLQPEQMATILRASADQLEDWTAQMRDEASTLTNCQTNREARLSAQRRHIMPIDIPTIRIAPQSNWEITLPASALLAAGLQKVSITDKGLYIEDVYGRYDLIPLDELALLLEGGA